MRPEPNLLVDRYRRVHPTLGESPSGSNMGYFYVPIFSHDSLPKCLHVISSGTDLEHGWEHVSVSYPERTPTWDEMKQIKELFWRDDETVVQFHPRKDRYVNTSFNCLHLWKPLGKPIELPPQECV